MLGTAAVSGDIRRAVPVLREWLHDHGLLRYSVVHVKDSLLATRLEARMQLQVQHGKMQLPHHHAPRPVNTGPFSRLSRCSINMQAKALQAVCEYLNKSTGHKLKPDHLFREQLCWTSSSTDYAMMPQNVYRLFISAHTALLGIH